VAQDPSAGVGSLVSEMPPVPVPRVRDVNGARVTEEGDDTVVDLNPADVESKFEAPPMGPEWHTNLADQLNPTQRKAIADRLLEYIDVDKQARKHHFERMRQGLELLGLEDLPEGDVPFDGAATVTDPLIGEAVVQFSSRAIEELMPATGPVKAVIVGEKTNELEEQAERIEDYLNYQLTEEDEGYFWDVDQMLFYLPMSGSAFKKIYPDPITGMTTARYVTAEDFIVPYYAKDLKSASRYAHEFKMQGNDIKRAQVDGYYLEDAQLIKPSALNEETHSSFSDSEEARLVDDREPSAHEDDEVYTFYEVHIDYELPIDDPEAKGAGDVCCPYIITIEKESREVLAVRRNWKKGDRKFQKRIWFVHYKFFPGLGFYGFGYLHIIGALARATSGAMRAVLDTAAMANMPGGFKSKKLKVAGEHRFTLGEWKDVDCSPEDLQQGFLPHPVKEPSPALANTYANLVKRGKEFASVVEVLTGEADNKGPVGTTLALIEQGSKPQSAIHKRLHAAMRQELKLMVQLNYEFMERDAYPYAVAGDKRQVLKQDFDGRVDVMPVSDPNIFSNTQRIAIAQGVLELVKQFNHQFGYKGERAAVKRMLQALRTPDIDELLPDSQPKNFDPVTENQYMATGKPVSVMPTQDDDAHMTIHQMFAQELALSDPELFKLVEPAFMSHRMEHIASRYRKVVEAQLGLELPPIDMMDPQATESLPPEVEVMISQAVAAKMRMAKREQEAASGGPPPTPEQAEAAAVENAKDAETVQKLERDRAAHIEKQKQAREAFELKQEQERASFLAEQRRLDEANRADIERAGAKAEADVANAKKVASARAMVRPPASRSTADSKRTPKPKKT
jgi:hypothetical protein